MSEASKPDGLRMPHTCVAAADELGMLRQGEAFNCPLCEKASCYISEVMWECEACDASGDVVELVKLVLDCDVPDAARWIEAHVPLPEAKQEPDSDSELSNEASLVGDVQLEPDTPRPQSLDADQSPEDESVDEKVKTVVMDVLEDEAEGAEMEDATDYVDALVAEMEDVDIGMADDEDAPGAPVEDEPLAVAGPAVRPGEDGEDDAGDVMTARGTAGSIEDPGSGMLIAFEGPLADVDIEPGDDLAEIYEHFMRELRPIPSKWINALGHWGISGQAIDKLGIRYYLHDYERLLRSMAPQHGLDSMIESGLFQEADDQAGSGTHVIMVDGRRLTYPLSTYCRANMPHMIVPFRRDGRVRYLKAIPLADAQTVAKRRLPSYIATAEHEPCLLNIDGVKGEEMVMLFVRELRAMAAISWGYPAVSCGSLSRFRPDWAAELADRKLYILVDQKRGDDQRIDDLAKEIMSNGGPVAHVVVRPESETWPKFLQDVVAGSDSVPVHPVTAEVLAAADGDALPAVSKSGSQNAISGDSAPAMPDQVEASGPPSAPPPSTGHNKAVPAKASAAPGKAATSPTGRFVACYPAGRRRQLVVTRLERSDGPYVQIRYWIQDKSSGKWRPEPRLSLLIPFALAKDVVGGTVAAITGHSAPAMPAWLASHPDGPKG